MGRHGLMYAIEDYVAETVDGVAIEENGRRNNILILTPQAQEAIGVLKGLAEQKFAELSKKGFDINDYANALQIYLALSPDRDLVGDAFEYFKEIAISKGPDYMGVVALAMLDEDITDFETQRAYFARVKTDPKILKRAQRAPGSLKAPPPVRIRGEDSPTYVSP